MTHKILHRTLKEHFPGPAPSFDAVEAVREHLGPRWTSVVIAVSTFKCAHCYKHLMHEQYGVSGFPAKAFWELIHGQNSFEKDFSDSIEKHKRKAFDYGLECAEVFAEVNLPEANVIYDGTPGFIDQFREGIRQGCLDRGLAEPKVYSADEIDLDE